MNKLSFFAVLAFGMVMLMMFDISIVYLFYFKLVSELPYVRSYLIHHLCVYQAFFFHYFLQSEIKSGLL